MKSLPVILSIIFGWSISACTTDHAESIAPNVVFILADDLGWAQTGCYGSTYYKTPHIDDLATRGLQFTQAYSAAAVCSPTRAALQTGKHPARLNLTDFVPGNDFPDSIGYQNPDWTPYLPLKEKTLGELFKEAGYVTGYFGKWHLSKEKRPPESLMHNPDRQGYDASMLTYKPTPQHDPENDAHNVHSITEKTVSFIRKHHQEPFFVMAAHNSIHDPLMAPGQLVSKYDSLSATQKPENHAIIAAMLEELDASVGKIIDVLDSLQVNENTLVIFYSDNGGKHDYAAQTPWRAGKGWLYEGGIRVPLIISWQGNIPAGGTSDLMVTSTDFFPTFAEILNQKTSLKDGQSFWKKWEAVDSTERRLLFWHYPHFHRGSGMQPASALRAGKYKLIAWKTFGPLAEDRVELYDLEKDRGESINLKNQLPGLADSLHQRLQDWKKEVGAQEAKPL